MASHLKTAQGAAERAEADSRVRATVENHPGRHRGARRRRQRDDIRVRRYGRRAVPYASAAE